MDAKYNIKLTQVNCVWIRKCNIVVAFWLRIWNSEALRGMGDTELYLLGSGEHLLI